MVNLAAFKPYIIVPLYLYPSPGAWKPLYDQISSHPGVNFQVIVNPNSGPGVALGSFPEQNWINTLTTLNSKPNVNTIGYVHVSWGERKAADVTKDIDTYAAWSSYKKGNIKVGGIFFDEAPDDDSAELVSYMHNVSSHARLRFNNRTTSHIVYNPGCPVPSVYYEQADSIVAFEDTYPHYSGKASSFPLSDIPPADRKGSVFMINSFPGNVAAQNQIIADLTKNNITGFFISNYNDYSKIPTLWPQLSNQIGSYNKKKA
ncbi:hypothetical protein K461DRAFT_294041 [Myriangium duriaei CBS 260.36]|uniref:Spherulation-specific family 4 n=1 Tax=Myriangium duriaei CBS 260.36 TaxID=1168546 RepID=A0A9P4MGQ9_9PEZI|nr:hypothetical protein K461DRAFT_294041 [Myriangium duriaei CBS 260.36]